MTESNVEETPAESEATPAPAPEPLPEDIAQALGDSVLDSSVQGATIRLTVRPEAIADACRYLRDRAAGAYQHLASLAGLDHADDLGVVYHLYELRGSARVVVHVRLPRSAPKLPSISDIFPAADWNEREAAELFGIEFHGHPDPRKLLLPEDWEGYPLRKDYVVPEHPFLTADARHELT